MKSKVKRSDHITSVGKEIETIKWRCFETYLYSCDKKLLCIFDIRIIQKLKSNSSTTLPSVSGRYSAYMRSLTDVLV